MKEHGVILTRWARPAGSPSKFMGALLLITPGNNQPLKQTMSKKKNKPIISWASEVHRSISFSLISLTDHPPSQTHTPCCNRNAHIREQQIIHRISWGKGF